MGYLDAHDALSVHALGGGYDVLGMFDLGAARKEMDGYRNLPVGAAQKVLARGQAAIDRAISVSHHWFTPNLPGEGERTNVQGHLNWHDVELKKVANNQYAPYVAAADLKEWVLRAFEEQNAAEEGQNDATFLKAMGDWADMWVEVGKWLADHAEKVAVEAGKVVATVMSLPGKVASTALEKATGVPTWAWWVGGGLAVGLVGLVSYKIITGPLGQTAVGIVAKRYLP